MQIFKKKWLWIGLGLLITTGTGVGVLFKFFINKNDKESQEQVDASKLIANMKNTDFIIPDKTNILPSYYGNKKILLNNIKSQAEKSKILSKTSIENILKKIVITFNPNDQTGVLQFTLKIFKSSKVFTISGFNTNNNILINETNKRIYIEVSKRIKPTIKPESRNKPGWVIDATDVKITPSDNSLTSKIITSAQRKGLNNLLKGSIVVFTIEVSSKVVGTKKVIYEVEVEGFLADLAETYYGVSAKAENFKNDDFVIDNKKNILPSSFKDIELIKNVYKKQIDDDTNLERLEKLTIKDAIDNNFIINFMPDDQKGILKFEVKIALNREYEFEISGFKKTV